MYICLSVYDDDYILSTYNTYIYYFIPTNNNIILYVRYNMYRSVSVRWWSEGTGFIEVGGGAGRTGHVYEMLAYTDRAPGTKRITVVGMFTGNNIKLLFSDSLQRIPYTRMCPTIRIIIIIIMHTYRARSLGQRGKAAAAGHRLAEFVLLPRGFGNLGP